MRIEAASPVFWLGSRVKIPVGLGGPSLRPMMWMFLAILVTFLLTRTATRLIRSGSGARAGLGNVRIAGHHVHHQVFGIVIMIGTGVVMVSEMPRGMALDAAAAAFGVGVGLTVDEFALLLHLEDVYWTDRGRKSVDAIFCVLVITGTLVGGADFVTGHVGTAGWWSSVAVIAVNLLLCVICLLKGKVVTGVTGTVIGVVALIGAIRLAKPGSWWAAHLYTTRPRRGWRAASRYNQRHQERWNRLRDLVGGAPSWERPAEMSPSVTRRRCRVWQVISSARPVPVGWSGRANVTTSIVRGLPSGRSDWSLSIRGDSRWSYLRSMPQVSAASRSLATRPYVLASSGVSGDWGTGIEVPASSSRRACRAKRRRSG